MLDITLVAVGQIKDNNWHLSALEYLKRLKPYARLKLIELRAEPFSVSSKAKAKHLESQAIYEFLLKKTSANIYLLSEHGDLFDSLSFAKKIDSLPELVFVIAGTQGFSEELFNKYPKISLSPLTFPHELARVLLLEQLYRATTILNGKSYHY